MNACEREEEIDRQEQICRPIPSFSQEDDVGFVFRLAVRFAYRDDRLGSLGSNRQQSL